MELCYDQLRVAVLGNGRSGRAAAAFLSGRGANVTVYDERESGEALPCGIRGRYGSFPSFFDEQLLVRSPVIRPDHPAIVQSVARGALLTSEIELLFRHAPCRIIGVTGSDGKTTTATLIATLLRGAGYRVHFGGNNGTPLLPDLDQMTAQDIAVLELSSFQLMTLDRSPWRAVITNITPNHLNWHPNMAEYAAAKHRIWQGGATQLVANAALSHELTGAAVPVTYFSVAGAEMILSDASGTNSVPVPGAFMLKGHHNLENLAAAYAAVRDLLPDRGWGDCLADFHGVAHRLQLVDTVNGVTFYDSSIDTTPTRTAAALQALEKKPILLLGGRGKGVPFDTLGALLAKRAKAVVLYGEAAAELSRAIGYAIPVYRHHAFADAFAAAVRVAQQGDTVLLSPACTAFDQFRDFEERGQAFCCLVAELKKK